MPETYGTHERAALFVLLLAGKPVPNPELVNEHGVKLSPAGRDKLNKAGLLETRTEKRTYVHRLTDKGIAWCERELATIEPPPRSGPLARTVFAIARLHAPHLKWRDDLESLIRAAYHELSVAPQDWVRLAKLRPKLNGAAKDEVDGVLRKMIKTGLVHLAPDSNRKVLTEADHAAAVRIGNEDNHLLAIEES